MGVTFRNVDVPDGTAIEDWPYEAIATVIERGTVTDWAVVTAAIRHDPWGPVARQVEQYLTYSQPWGVAPLLGRAIAAARASADSRDRAAVAAEVRELVASSGLTIAAFAERIGTSRSRMSTYCNGRVTPSAALLRRMTHLVDRLQVRPTPASSDSIDGTDTDQAISRRRGSR